MITVHYFFKLFRLLIIKSNKKSIVSGSRFVWNTRLQIIGHCACSFSTQLNASGIPSEFEIIRTMVLSIYLVPLRRNA